MTQGEHSDSEFWEIRNIRQNHFYKQPLRRPLRDTDHPRTTLLQLWSRLYREHL